MSIHHALLPSRALIALGGEDWRSFLQGLITQDVETLAAGEARFAALLTPQGKLMYDLFVVGQAEGCWLEVEAEHREALIQRLKMYRLRAKAEIAADETPVSALWGGPAPAQDEWVTDPRLPGLGFRSYGASLPATDDEEDYDAHRLELGVPGPADWGFEQTYPIEANFDLLGGIDFKKGCFIGQETTSRMKRRGQIKTRMLPINFDGEGPAFGSEILAGTLRAGEVLSGMDGRAMASLRLDRIAGELTADGWEVRVERPDWMAADQPPPLS
ncbi:folate-binding protein YgfZ [Phenylobacterium aquaticum]|uniref:CAF17-like 4Fe-4S cluster assembly/insertion protein YgfZ n=1 Tax=Phenylobacterium aquaticum TaxID=1763816 RepID=UPI0026F0100B|nr:folate-binding protein YgfZ [Phenylobacterium aquaticum]